MCVHLPNECILADCNNQRYKFIFFVQNIYSNPTSEKFKLIYSDNCKDTKSETLFLCITFLALL